MIFPLVMTLLFSGCSLLSTYPVNKSTEQRLKSFPLENWKISSSIQIHWNSYLIPFIEAESDDDAAFALGVVHAHLRLGQMELFKRIASGRLSEMGGPFYFPEIDRVIRTIGIAANAQNLYAQLSGNEKVWVDRYVEGVNFYQAGLEELPPEFKFLNMEKEPWTGADVMKIMRLAGVDLTWMLYSKSLALKDQPGWNDLWKQILDQSEQYPASSSDPSKALLQHLMRAFSKSGSNSVAVSGSRTRSGAALLANDPHLGVFAPNFWILAGYKSPSFHNVGLMIPGVPAVLVGRNPEISWGGTNMRAISSHLFKATPEQIHQERTEVLKVRWWFDREIKIRESTNGPIISDTELFKSKDLLAMKWLGRESSSELSAFLKANKAQNWQEFRQAFKDYGVSGQNILYADRKGNIGLLLAVKQPLLEDPSEHDQLIKSSSNKVSNHLGSLDLPSVFNPKTGYLASANNKPLKTQTRLAYSYSHPDRILRLKSLLESSKPVETSTLMQWQQDVFSESSHRINLLLIKDVEKSQLPLELAPYFEALSHWNGEYRADSVGALAFEVLITQLKELLVEFRKSSTPFIGSLLDGDNWRSYLEVELPSVPTDQRVKLIQTAMKRSLSEFNKFKDWGDKHPLTLKHPMGNIPWLGKRFQFETLRAPGSSTTLRKRVLPKSPMVPSPDM